MTSLARADVVMAIGLNPLRVLRAAAMFRPQRLWLISTPETAHIVPEIAAALAGLSIESDVRIVPGDAYRWDVTTGALLAAADSGLPSNATWVIVSGTKPMVAAQETVAHRLRGEVVIYDDWNSRLVLVDRQTVKLRDLPANLKLRQTARLHAGFEVIQDDQPPIARKGRDWDPTAMRQRLSVPLNRRFGKGRKRSDTRHDAAIAAEADLAALIRAVLPPVYEVQQNVTVQLRDPFLPDRLAMEPPQGRRERTPRRFELDVVVTCRGRSWVVENKNFKPQEKEARVAAAELDLRRRHFGGDGCVGYLFTCHDEIPPNWQQTGNKFELGRVEMLGERILVEALDAVIVGGDVAHTELARLFA